MVRPAIDGPQSADSWSRSNVDHPRAMTLQSWTFLFGLLPVTLLGLVWLIRARHILSAVTFLIGASLVFLGMQTLSDAVLVLCSIMFNYGLGSWIRSRSQHEKLRGWMLFVGIATNVGVLAYFKYFDYLVDNLNAILGSSYDPAVPGFTPVGISFLTFQQIAFLVDCSRESMQRTRVPFVHYALFSCFFPKQIAGPILRQDEFIPQINVLDKTVNTVSIMEGLTRFLFGYAQKVVVADSLAVYAAPVFDAASAGKPLGFIVAWGGVLAFTFQLYFDFVGYTDMALGAARMLGFHLPENFMSPYRATSVSDFWRRWHMTLSRFLRDYLYIPLGGNRKGFARQLANLLVTMTLGGLWHGASWTFVIWGALHGLYLGVNHAWRKLGMPCSAHAGWILTFLGVVYAWVWFRADTAEVAVRVTQAMIGMEGLWPDGTSHPLSALQMPAARYSSLAWIFQSLNVALTYDRWTIYPVNILLSEPVLQAFWLSVSAVLIWILPTAQECLNREARDPAATWPGTRGVLLACLFFLALLVSMQETARTFVYSQF
jgi:alginate O-acetyltransferase complex protein AlgI